MYQNKRAFILFFIIVLLFGSGTGKAFANPFSDEPIIIENGTQEIEEPQEVQEPEDIAISVEQPGISVRSEEVAADPIVEEKELSEPERGPEIKVGDSEVIAAAPAVSDDLVKILPGYDEVSISIDGDNCCGQFSMASVFQGMGIDKDPQQIFRDTNPSGIFTAPPVIVDYLNKNGVAARQLNNASVEDIIKKIDAGKPVIVLVHTSGGVPHWINIYGYTKNADGSLKSFTMRDSVWGTRRGYEMDAATFVEKWKKPFGPSIGSHFVDYSNLMIDIDGDSTSPRSPFETATEDNIASGLNEVVTGYTNKDWGQLAGGLTKLAGGIPGAVTNLISKVPGVLGEMMSDWGSERWERGGLGNRVIGGAAVVGGKALEAVSWVGQTIGNASSKLSSTIGNGIRSLFGR